MPQRNSLGVISGLAFVAIFLVMLMTVGQAPKVVHSPLAPAMASSNADFRPTLIRALHPTRSRSRIDWRPAAWLEPASPEPASPWEGLP
jgi:hypothetical protein